MASYRKDFVLKVMFLDDFTCVYCGKRSNDLELDHFYPISKGGDDNIHNLVAACRSCNMSKHNKTAQQWGIAPKFGRFSNTVKEEDLELLRKTKELLELKQAQMRPPRDTDDVLLEKLALWLAFEPKASTRKLAKMLFPGTDGGGYYSVKVKALRNQLRETPITINLHNKTTGETISETIYG